MPQPFSFSVNVPRDNLAPYLQQRGQTLAGITGSVDELTKAISATLQARAQAENQRRAQAQFQKDMAIWRADPTTDNYVNMLIRNPWAKDQAEAAFKATEEGERKSILSYALPAYSALSAGDPVAAGTSLIKQKLAFENSGQPEEAAKIQSLIDDISDNPNAARGNLQMLVARGVGPEKALEFIQGIEKLPSETRKSEAEAGIKEVEKAIKDIELQRLPGQLRLADDKTQAEINNYNSQIKDRADRLLLDGYKSVNEANAKAAEIRQRNQEIPKVFVEKLVEFQDNAVLSAGVASKAYDLSIRFQTTQMPSGAEARFDKWLDDQIGVRDAQGVLRKEYEALTTDKTIQKLGGLKGAASDRDVALVQSTNLLSISDPKVLSSWLAGLAKLHTVSKTVNEIRSEWIEMNGSRGTASAQQDMTIGGYDVPRGMSLSRFEQVYGDKIFADAVRSLESGYLTKSSYMQGIDLNAPEQDFGAGMSFPPEEQ